MRYTKPAILSTFPALHVIQGTEKAIAVDNGNPLQQSSAGAYKSDE